MSASVSTIFFRRVVPMAAALLACACAGSTATSQSGATSLATTAAAPATTAPTTATSTATTSPGALTAGELVWLQGIAALGKKMTKAVTDAPSNMTETSMRSLAGKFRSCTPERAKLGAPTDRLKAVDVLAERGCAKYAEAAACFTRAASIHVVGSGSLEKVKKQLDCAAAATGKAGELLADAELKGFDIQTASQ